MRVPCTVLALMVFASVSISRASPAWRDPSPHTTTFVTVDQDVKLEVLDWGGSGPSLVFIPGLENTAHVFDDFAPKFTKDFHVYGFTFFTVEWAKRFQHFERKKKRETEKQNQRLKSTRGRSELRDD